ncbi:MAG: DUF1311 domain-containing protein [Alphaproteobacteria bacterium]|nr:DUF1311 domain-containing protein [Alphaproteobacteria bacterium]
MLGCAALLAAASAGAALAQASPSFDCARARSSAERLICAEPQLAGVDRDMAAAYRRALAAVRTAKDRETLGRDQVEWLKGRDEACFFDDGKSGGLPPADQRQWSAGCLLAMYGYRTSLLLDVAALGHVPGPGSGAPLPMVAGGDVAGRYATGGFGWYGSMTIARKGDALEVAIDTVAGATAHGCNLAGKAAVAGDRLTAVAHHDEDRPRPDERCTLVLTPIAGGFSVAAQEGEACRFFCGARGVLEGDYYRVPNGRR